MNIDKKKLSFEFSLVEKLREIAVSKLFENKKKFTSNWKTLEKKIKAKIGKEINEVTGEKIFNLPDDLREIFFSLLPKETKNKRSQSLLPIAGDGWERTVAWYLNLCLINTRAVVFKKRKSFFSNKILDALTVDINGKHILSESDLIGIIIPENDNLKLEKSENKLLKSFREFTDKNYKKFELFGIQCKTNFADDVERPLLYQILYNLPTQLDIGIKIGVNGTHVNDFKKFKYSFITIPSQKDERIPTNDTAPAIRAKLFSGGCYWAMPSKKDVADSLKEFMSRNFSSVLPQGNATVIKNLDENIVNLKTKYKYFRLNY